MSNVIVGNELLPNVYIRNIQINDGYGENTVSVGVKVCVLDTELESFWSHSNRIMSTMSIMLVASPEDIIGDLITQGEIDFSERALSKRINSLKEVSIDFRTPTIMSRSFLTNTEPVIIDGLKYYNFDFEFSHQLDAPELKIFAAVYMDEMKAKGVGTGAVSLPEKSFYGPISSESIFINSELNRVTTIFLLPNGNQYMGPVHMHDGTYMAGATHSSVDHPVLTTTDVFNYKIKDYRQTKPDAMSRPIIKDNFYTPFTKLYDSVMDLGNIAGIFGINLRDILIHKTKFGKALEGLNPVVLESMLSSFSIKRMSVVRSRIGISFGTNKIGSPIETYRDSGVVEDIIVSYDEGGFLKPLTRLSKNRDFYYDVVLEDLPFLEAGEEPMAGQIYANSLGDYEVRGSIKEVFLQDKTIRYFEFEDAFMNDNRVGEYMYEVNFSFKDPTIPFVQSLFNTILMSLKKVKDYNNILSTSKYYMHSMDQTTESFLNYQEDLYEGRLNAAPWIEAPLLLVKMYSYLYNIEEDNLDFLLNKFSSKLNPKFATIKSVASFMEEMEKMINKMINYFSFSPSQIKENSLKVFPRNTPKSTLIDIKHRFENIIVPVENKMRYNFLEPDASPGFLRLTQEDFLNRLAQEQSKLYEKGPKVYESNQSIDPEVMSGLSNTTGFSYGYMSPMSVVGNGVNISLMEPESVDVDEFNELFKNIEVSAPPRPNMRSLTFRPRKVRRGRRKSRVMALMGNALKIEGPSSGLRRGSALAVMGHMAPPTEILESDSEDEKMINSEEYFGFGSEFAIYDEDLRPPPITELIPKMASVLGSKISNIPTHKKLQADMFNIDSPTNLINKLKNTGNSSDIGTKVAKLPMHIKALFLSRFSKTKNKLDPQNDILSMRDTQLLSKVTYFTLIRVERLIGYEMPVTSNEKLLNKPIWSTLNPDDILDLGEHHFCRMVYHTDEEFKVGVEEKTNLSFTNKYFFISRSDLNDPPIITSTVDEDNNKVIQEYYEAIDFDMKYATNNIITQAANTAYNPVSTVASPPANAPLTTGTSSSIATDIPSAPAASAPMGGGGGSY